MLVNTEVTEVCKLKPNKTFQWQFIQKCTYILQSSLHIKALCLLMPNYNNIICMTSTRWNQFFIRFHDQFSQSLTFCYALKNTAAAGTWYDMSSHCLGINVRWSAPSSLVYLVVAWKAAYAAVVGVRTQPRPCHFVAIAEFIPAICKDWKNSKVKS